MSNVIDSLEREQLRRVPSFQAGDRLKVHFQVVEGNRRRTQVFEGVVIKRQGTGVRETFTVRKQSFGVGVERTFPVHSPKIERIEVASRGDVRRAKLYYLRGRIGKRARVRERQYTGQIEEVLLAEPGGAMDAEGAQEEAEVLHEEPAAEGDAPAAEGETPAAEGEAPAVESEAPAAEGESPTEGADAQPAEAEATEAAAPADEQPTADEPIEEPDSGDQEPDSADKG